MTGVTLRRLKAVLTLFTMITYPPMLGQYYLVTTWVLAMMMSMMTAAATRSEGEVQIMARTFR